MPTNPITATNLTYNGGYNNSGTSYVTASITPTGNKVVLLIVASNIETGGTPAVPTISGGGFSSWTLVDTFTNTSNPGIQRISIFKAYAANPTSGAITIDFAGVSQNACCWSVNQFDNLNTNNPIGQIVKQGGTSDGSGNYSIAMGRFQHASNATLGMYCDIRAADFPHSNPGASFTQLSQTYSTLAVEFANNNQSAVNWTALANSVNVASIAIELKAKQVFFGFVG